jgi:hypothetical protein
MAAWAIFVPDIEIVLTDDTSDEADMASQGATPGA